MKSRSSNTHMFALPQGPPQRLEIAGATYSLSSVFKHDFFAATCLYETAGIGNQEPGTRNNNCAPAGYTPFPVPDSRFLIPDSCIVVKFMREQSFCGFPMAWCARLLAGHEEAIYKALEGVRGVPRWIGRVGQGGFAIEYVPGRPMDHPPAPPAGFFDELRELLNAIHARGVAYCDANKRSNVLIGPGDKPFLVDYQISIRLRNDLPWPLRSIVRWAVAYVTRADIYHLYKHKRRIAPQELTEQEKPLSRRRGLLHHVHRKLTDPWRILRRRFLARQYAGGRLVSPTAAIEDHHQPEKATWRKT